MTITILEYDEGDLISEHSILNATKDKAVEMILKHGTGDDIPDWTSSYYNIELGEINIIIELEEDEIEDVKDNCSYPNCTCFHHELGTGVCEE